MPFKNVTGHLKTVRKHRREVRKLCFKCGLYKQGLLHDLSKYSPSEFLSSVKYWTGNRSPIDNQIDDIGFSEAWLHHKGRNKHHYEYWIDQSHGDPEILCDIPFKYVAEMFCDRVAATKTYLKEKYTESSPLDYALKKQEKEKQLMNENTYSEIMGLLKNLSENGEKDTVKKIKERLKESKNYAC